MAGPSIGTWVKVRNKSGRMTSRVIPNKFGGGGYSQGEVITQSEFKKVQEKRAESKSAKDGLKLQPRGTEMQRREDARRKASKDANDRMKNNEFINTMGVKGKTQNREFNIVTNNIYDGSQSIKSVKGSVRGAFGIHEDGGVIKISHLATGMSVRTLRPGRTWTKGEGFTTTKLTTKGQVRKVALSLADKLSAIDGIADARSGKDVNVLRQMRDAIESTIEGY